MTNKLVAIINSLRVPKIKKILLYEMKLLVPNYSCLQNPWIGGYRPQIPVISIHCPQLNFLNPPSNKIPGYATAQHDMRWTSNLKPYNKETLWILYCRVRADMRKIVVCLKVIAYHSFESTDNKKMSTWACREGKTEVLRENPVSAPLFPSPFCLTRNGPGSQPSPPWRETGG